MVCDATALYHCGSTLINRLKATLHQQGLFISIHYNTCKRYKCHVKNVVELYVYLTTYQVSIACFVSVVCLLRWRMKSISVMPRRQSVVIAWMNRYYKSWAMIWRKSWHSGRYCKKRERRRCSIVKEWSGWWTKRTTQAMKMWTSCNRKAVPVLWCWHIKNITHADSRVYTEMLRQ